MTGPISGLPKSGRYIFLGKRQSLADLLAGKIEIDMVLENHRNHGQAEAGERADFFDALHAVHGGFDRKGNVPFDFHRSHRRCAGNDLHLNAGNIGHRIDGELAHGKNAGGDDETRKNQDQKSKFERKLSNRSSIFHRSVSVPFEALFEKFRFKRESARDDHLLAFFQSYFDLNAATEVSAEIELSFRERPVLLLHEYRGLTFYLLDSR